MDDPTREENRPPVLLTPVLTRSRRGFRLSHLMYLVVAFAVLFWMARFSIGGLLVFSLITVIALIVSACVLLARRNATQQESLLWALAIAAERGVPLPPAALAFGDQFGRGYRWRVQLLAAFLEEGKSLPDAVDLVPGLLTREAQVLIRTGWATSTLPQALRQAADLRSERRSAWGAIADRVTYLVTLILACQVVASFISYYILPKYAAIFKDFGVPLPRITGQVVSVLSVLNSPFAVLFVPIIVLEVVVLALLPLGGFDLFQWSIPFIDALFKRRHRSLLLRSLSLGVEGGRPIETTLQSLSGEYPSSWVRNRLSRAVTEIEQGNEWVQSLMDGGLILRSEGALLRAAQRVGNLPWALRQAATSSERRLGYRIRLIGETLFPLAIICVGLAVFLLCLAFFYPIVTLIQVLA